MDSPESDVDYLEELESRLYSQVFHSTSEINEEFSDISKLKEVNGEVPLQSVRNYRYFMIPNLSKDIPTNPSTFIPLVNHAPSVECKEKSDNQFIQNNISITPTSTTVVTDSNRDNIVQNNITVNQFTVPLIIQSDYPNNGQVLNPYGQYINPWSNVFYEPPNHAEIDRTKQIRRKRNRSKRRGKKQTLSNSTVEPSSTIADILTSKPSVAPVEVITLSDESSNECVLVEAMEPKNKENSGFPKKYEENSGSKKTESDDDVIYIPPTPPEIINIDIEESEESVNITTLNKMQCNLSTLSNPIHKENSISNPIETSASNDFLDTAIVDSTTKFNFGLHGADFNNHNDFVRPANPVPVESCETESSCSTNEQSRDFNNTVKTIVFDEVEFPIEDIFSEKNLESFKTFITPQRNSKSKIDLNEDRHEKMSHSKKMVETLNSESSTESDYEEPEKRNKNSQNIELNKMLPILSPMLSENEHVSNNKNYQKRMTQSGSSSSKRKSDEMDAVIPNRQIKKKKWKKSDTKLELIKSIEVSDHEKTKKKKRTSEKEKDSLFVSTPKTKTILESKSNKAETTAVFETSEQTVVSKSKKRKGKSELISNPVDNKDKSKKKKKKRYILDYANQVEPVLNTSADENENVQLENETEEPQLDDERTKEALSMLEQNNMETIDIEDFVVVDSIDNDLSGVITVEEASTNDIDKVVLDYEYDSRDSTKSTEVSDNEKPKKKKNSSEKEEVPLFVSTPKRKTLSESKLNTEESRELFETSEQSLGYRSNKRKEKFESSSTTSYNKIKKKKKKKRNTIVSTIQLESGLNTSEEDIENVYVEIETEEAQLDDERSKEASSTLEHNNTESVTIQDFKIIDSIHNDLSQLITIDEASITDDEVVDSDNEKESNEAVVTNDLQLANCISRSQPLISAAVISNDSSNTEIQLNHHQHVDKPFNMDDILRSQSDNPEKWQVSFKDRTSYLYRSRERGPRCNKCRRTGHTAIRCTEKPDEPACILCGTRGHQESRCTVKMCNQCGRHGDYNVKYCRSCFAIRDTECLLCHMPGHLEKYCPDLWRRYHLTTEDGSPLDNSHSIAMSENVSKEDASRVTVEDCALQDVTPIPKETHSDKTDVVNLSPVNEKNNNYLSTSQFISVEKNDDKPICKNLFISSSTCSELVEVDKYIGTDTFRAPKMNIEPDFMCILSDTQTSSTVDKYVSHNLDCHCKIPVVLNGLNHSFADCGYGCRCTSFESGQMSTTRETYLLDVISSYSENNIQDIDAIENNNKVNIDDDYNISSGPRNPDQSDNSLDEISRSCCDFPVSFDSKTKQVVPCLCREARAVNSSALLQDETDLGAPILHIPNSPKFSNISVVLYGLNHSHIDDNDCTLSESALGDEISTTTKISNVKNIYGYDSVEYWSASLEQLLDVPLSPIHNINSPKNELAQEIVQELAVFDAKSDLVGLESVQQMHTNYDAPLSLASVHDNVGALGVITKLDLNSGHMFVESSTHADININKNICSVIPYDKMMNESDREMDIDEQENMSIDCTVYPQLQNSQLNSKMTDGEVEQQDISMTGFLTREIGTDNAVEQLNDLHMQVNVQSCKEETTTTDCFKLETGSTIESNSITKNLEIQPISSSMEDYNTGIGHEDEVARVESTITVNDADLQLTRPHDNFVNVSTIDTNKHLDHYTQNLSAAATPTREDSTDATVLLTSDDLILNLTYPLKRNLLLQPSTKEKAAGGTSCQEDLQDTIIPISEGEVDSYFSQSNPHISDTCVRKDSQDIVVPFFSHDSVSTADSVDSSIVETTKIKEASTSSLTESALSKIQTDLTSEIQDASIASMTNSASSKTHIVLTNTFLGEITNSALLKIQNDSIGEIQDRLTVSITNSAASKIQTVSTSKIQRATTETFSSKVHTVSTSSFQEATSESAFPKIQTYSTTKIKDTSTSSNNESASSKIQTDLTSKIQDAPIVSNTNFASSEAQTVLTNTIGEAMTESAKVQTISISEIKDISSVSTDNDIISSIIQADLSNNNQKMSTSLKLERALSKLKIDLTSKIYNVSTSSMSKNSLLKIYTFISNKIKEKSTLLWIKNALLEIQPLIVCKIKEASTSSTPENASSIVQSKIQEAISTATTESTSLKFQTDSTSKIHDASVSAITKDVSTKIHNNNLNASAPQLISTNTLTSLKTENAPSKVQTVSTNQIQKKKIPNLKNTSHICETHSAEFNENREMKFEQKVLQILCPFTSQPPKWKNSTGSIFSNSILEPDIFSIDHEDSQVIAKKKVDVELDKLLEAEEKRMKMFMMSKPSEEVRQFLKSELASLKMSVRNGSCNYLKNKLIKYDKVDQLNPITRKVLKERCFWFKRLNMFIFGNDRNCTQRHHLNVLKRYIGHEDTNKSLKTPIRLCLLQAYNHIFGGRKHDKVNYYNCLKQIGSSYRKPMMTNRKR